MNNEKKPQRENCRACLGGGWFRSSISKILTKCPRCRGTGYESKKELSLANESKDLLQKHI